MRLPFVSSQIGRVGAGLVVGGLLVACGSKSDTQPQIPYAPVNLSLSLGAQEYAALRFDNGAVTIPAKGPAGNGGVKGVIVVRQSAGTFLAFERNCPYRPYDACATVSLDRNSKLFMRDSCCTSQFDLKGQVTGGPAPLPLKQYSVSVQGNLISVVN
ncbi:hypothetical protein MON38_14880 [Hymenobacter sp. DH14]|uniref:Rieske domain-containing protein n=1 Tax=Hymenobacter cyanobacteriorum TaxID=2926463 RepID=A0A9X2AIK0_9BACT|nr:hypothetical protein [Hymenobacter cyanobacteriorum]MCI1188710.1 hypothetical protein [Hymenobacter cyanobacteriorum]